MYLYYLPLDEFNGLYSLFPLFNLAQVQDRTEIHQNRNTDQKSRTAKNQAMLIRGGGRACASLTVFHHNCYKSIHANSLGSMSSRKLCIFGQILRILGAGRDLRHQIYRLHCRL